MRHHKPWKKLKLIFDDDEGNEIAGTSGHDLIKGHGGNDMIESGAGSDLVMGGKGNDTILSFSWGGEPEIAQETDAAKVEAGEPIPDNDRISGGRGEDTFTFRWLIDAKAEILDAHRDDTGNVDYQAVAGENSNAHDHWVEHMGHKTIVDFNPEDDSLVFEGHTVNLAKTLHADVNGDGTIDTVFSFVSIQTGSGAQIMGSSGYPSATAQIAQFWRYCGDSTDARHIYAAILRMCLIMGRSRFT